MKKLRLLITEECNRNCEGCCNKDWKLDDLPICTSFEGYDEILLTGGEPTLKPISILCIINIIREKNPKAKIYMYSASSLSVLYTNYLDGITYTIHDQKSVEAFYNIYTYFNKDRSNRLNIFKGVILPKDIDLSGWKVKYNMEWVKNCPLPKDEVFMRINRL